MEFVHGEVIFVLNHLILILQAMLDIEIENGVSGHSEIAKGLLRTLDLMAVDSGYRFVVAIIQLIAD